MCIRDRAYACGSQHSLYGVRDFVMDMPDADVFHTRICNYACRYDEKEAQQIATVVCRVANYVTDQDLQTFEFSALFSNTWIKEQDSWKRCV